MVPHRALFLVGLHVLFEPFVVFEALVRAVVSSLPAHDERTGDDLFAVGVHDSVVVVYAFQRLLELVLLQPPHVAIGLRVEHKEVERVISYGTR